MKYVKHRLNRVADLDSLESREWGCEIDLRSDVTRPGRLVLSHDPWGAGEDFATWLEAYAKRGQAGPLILNTKEDGLEDEILRQVERAGVKNHFFLDTAFPTLVKWTVGRGRRDFALRLSKHENIEGHAGVLAGVDWLWVDCFDREPLVASAVASVKVANKVLVSPELQGGGENDFPRFAELARACTHLCTKNPAAWRRLLG